MGDFSPVTEVVMTVFTLAVSVLALWTTWVCFMGGTIPLVGWETQGSLVLGVLFLMLGWPLLLTLAFPPAVLIVIPLEAIFNNIGSEEEE